MQERFGLRIWPSLLVWGLAAGLAAAEASVPLIPRRAIFAGTQRLIPQISPDGNNIAYLAPNKGRLNIWVRSVAGGDDRPVTTFADYSVRFFQWTYDGHTLIFYRDKGGDEKFHSFAVDVKGGAPRDLFPASALGVGKVQLSPLVPDEGLVWAQADWHGRGATAPFLYRVNLASGKFTPKGGLPGSFWPDNKFKVRLSAGWDPGDVLFSRTTEEAPWQKILALRPEEEFVDVLGFSPDDQQAYLNASLGSDTTRLLALDLTSGKWAPLAGDPDYDMDDALFDPQSHKLLAVSTMRQRLQWQFMDEGTRRDFALLGAVAAGDIRILSQDLTGQLWTVQFERDQAPPKYYLFDRHSGQAKLLFGSLPELDGYPLASMYPVSFTARDGLKLEAYLSLPPGFKGRPPLLLVVHGGPRARDRWGFDPEVQWLCNRGYAVLQVNYRASTGYGKKFRNAGNTEWGRKSSTDILDGKQWAIQAGYADPQRVGIYGASYGGYAALVGLAFTPKEYRCGVDICGPSSLVTLFKRDGQEFFSSWGSDRKGAIEVDQLAEISPLNSASRIEAPLFIAQGENDPRVPKRESEQIVQSLKDRGKDYEYVLFKDEGHGFRKWENQLALNGKLEAFLAKHLGGRAEAADPQKKP